MRSDRGWVKWVWLALAAVNLTQAAVDLISGDVPRWEDTFIALMAILLAGEIHDCEKAERKVARVRAALRDTVDEPSGVGVWGPVQNALLEKDRK